MSELALPFAAGLIAAAMNAVAGGGTFVALPALIASGLPAVSANASSTVALVPGSFTSAWVYRDQLGPVAGVPMPAMAAASLGGGLVGSLLLLWTPAHLFDVVLPWLLLLATFALAFGRRVAARAGGGRQGRLALPLQAVLGVYGGYFGGAVGLMMLATWSLLGAGDVKALQGPRTLLVSAANIVAALVFAAAGAVWWPQALAMLAGGLVGGYAGARLGRVLPSAAVRAGTVGLTATVTAVFFWRAYVA